jgi:hypothetical protein
MAEVLSEYLAMAAAQPFQYGVMDCALFCIGWADVVTHKAGVAAWRGRYDDFYSCMDYTARNGGMTALAETFLAETYGIRPGASPDRGNIVLAKHGNVTAFGLRVSETDIAFRLERGMLVTKRADVTHEWGLPCPK